MMPDSGKVSGAEDGDDGLMGCCGTSRTAPRS
jgi:hypothetical protein